MASSCVKCNLERAIILVGTNGSFCLECFEKYFTHKFRAALGKNPIVRHGDKVGVAFSGGNNSSALLHLLLESITPTAFKRLKFHPELIFVDETTILPPGDYRNPLAGIQKVLESSGLPFAVVKLEEALKLDEGGRFIDLSNSEASAELKSLFESVISATSKEELLYRLRCKLLAYKAKELGYKHIFSGETSTRLAVNILSNIAQGRGGHLSLDTGFTDDGRYFGINLLRPLREISAKEIAVYNAIHKVTSVFFPTFSTMQPRDSSIQTLTEDFIVSLSANFPSTETTVFRTSNKLQMSKSKDKNTSDRGQKTCPMCHGPLDNKQNTNGAAALGAIDFTEKLCARDLGSPDCPLLPDLLNFSEEISGTPHNWTEVSGSDLCHCCGIVRKDIPEETRTQNPFAQAILGGRKLTEDEMKEQLEGLLLKS